MRILLEPLLSERGERTKKFRLMKELGQNRFSFLLLFTNGTFQICQMIPRFGSSCSRSRLYCDHRWHPNCRATAVAAKYLNLDCFLILRTSKGARIDNDPGLSGNLLVACLVGAHIDLVSKEEYSQVHRES
ncbi:hypothetical protein Leryth_025997 [Lithospermum erythrorhizon]|nr:hypothetical protein Leryth_025997 [Lithospermum erythrorhizon]